MKNVSRVTSNTTFFFLAALSLIVCIASLPSDAYAADVITYSAGKLHHFFQFTSGSPTEDTLNPWEAGANVYFANKTNVYASTFGPLGSPTNSMLFQNNRYEYQRYYTSQSALNAALPNGTYTIKMDTVHDGTNTANVSFPVDAYPAAPHFNAFAAAQAVNPTNSFTLTWDAFTGGTTNDQILLIISPTPNESRTNFFSSPLPNQPGALNGTNLQVVIPANTLPFGYSGYAKLAFLKVSSSNTTAYPTVTGYGGFGSVTIMPFVTSPWVGLPQIIQSPLSRTGAIGSTVIFSVNATGGNLIYRWKKNGVDIPGATSDIFSIPELLSTNAGNYTVAVSNSFGGVISSPAVLTAVVGTVGARDPQFNKQDCPNNYIEVIRQQSDGKILAGGPFTSFSGTKLTAMAAVARFNADGTLDTTFTIGSTLSGAQVKALEIQPDQKIMIAGSLGYYGPIWLGNVARLNPDGGLDLSFSRGIGANNWVYALALQPDGKVLIGGSFTAYNGVTRNGIARLNSDGSLDATFNPGTGVTNGTVQTIVVQSDGGILVGGTFTNFNGLPRNRITGLNTNGSVNVNFNIGTGADNGVESIALQQDNNILVGGLFNNFNGVLHRKIVRLFPSGATDPMLPTNAITSTFGNSLGEVASIAVQPSGKILLAGEFTFYTGIFDNNLVRINSDGTKDTNFTAGTDQKIYSVIAPPDGSIAIAGIFESYGGCNIVKLLSSSGLESPSIVTQPLSQTNNFGTSTTFSVTGFGGSLSYQWFKNGVAISGATNSSLTIPYPQEGDAGTYSVIVSNTLGSIQSADAVLTVQMTPHFVWARATKSTATAGGRGVAVDFYGNAYVAGFFAGTATLNSNISSISASQDILLAKFDSAGNPLWARAAGGTGADAGQAVALDATGNVFITGLFRLQATFGATVLTNAGNSDVFLAKYDLNGNLLWARSAGGAGGDNGLALATDANGNVFLSGFYNGDANFGANHITGQGTFLAKYDSAGNAIWARGISAALCCNAGRGLATDGAGNVYMAGVFAGTVSFGTNNLTTAGGNDIFLAKYDSAGNALWVRRAGGAGNDDAYGVAIASDGGVAVTGYFYTAADFATSNLTAHGPNAELFVAKYTPQGIFQWVRQAGGALDVAGYGIKADAAGHLWVTGEFSGTADFSGRSLTASGTASLPDAFIARYDNAGGLTAVYQAGGTNSDFGAAIGMDGGGSAYITGDFRAIAGFGNLSLTNTVTTPDLFLTKVAAGIAKPALTLSPDGLTLSWGVGSVDWNLLRATNLAGPFTLINPARTTNAGVIQVSLPANGNQSFYQLQHP